MKKEGQKKEIKKPLEPFTKSTITVVFWTIFLDLLGFTIIFPMFPALADYYMLREPDSFFLNIIFKLADFIMGTEGQGVTPIVLFGGILGGFYSLLQFIGAPIWGSLSDKWGRRPILLVSSIGMMLSYVLWFFSGSFALLVFARLIGGLMGGNISTATAAIADVTRPEERTRGMAFVGMAFAAGFLVGPAIGGLLSLVDLTLYFPSLESFGVNPFSCAAAAACLFSVGNILMIWKRFKETLPKEKRNKKISERTMNPILLFRPLPFRGFNLTNYAHFLFLAAFSGMEFTLTFLAVERLNYSSLDNAYLFIFIGVVIGVVQGGVVRRVAHKVGERKMVIIGLLALIPGLLILSQAHSTAMLYGGLFFLAVGSSLIIPCLTGLISLFTPPEHQGKAIGLFRSFGALARVVGPLTASVIYWKWGSAQPYILGALFLLIPLIMVALLPAPVPSPAATKS